MIHGCEATVRWTFWNIPGDRTLTEMSEHHMHIKQLLFLATDLLVGSKWGHITAECVCEGLQPPLWGPVQSFRAPSEGQIQDQQGLTDRAAAAAAVEVNWKPKRSSGVTGEDSVKRSWQFKPTRNIRVIQTPHPGGCSQCWRTGSVVNQCVWSGCITTWMTDHERSNRCRTWSPARSDHKLWKWK